MPEKIGMLITKKKRKQKEFVRHRERINEGRLTQKIFRVEVDRVEGRARPKMTYKSEILKSVLSIVTLLFRRKISV